jgi:hypothetical protein
MIGSVIGDSPLIEMVEGNKWAANHFPYFRWLGLGLGPNPNAKRFRVFHTFAGFCFYPRLNH